MAKKPEPKEIPVIKELEKIDLQSLKKVFPDIDKGHLKSILHKIERAQALPHPRERVEAVIMTVIQELPSLLRLLAS
jgi:hypothetical protein